MKSKIALLFIFVLGAPILVWSQASPGSKPIANNSYSETMDSVYTSSCVLSRGVNPDGVQDSVTLATGVVALKGINVSAQGFNAKLRLFDRSTGTPQAFLFDDLVTSSQTYIPYTFESSSGVVYLSTCTSCLSPWTAPVLRFDFTRKR